MSTPVASESAQYVSGISSPVVLISNSLRRSTSRAGDPHDASCAVSFDATTRPTLQTQAKSPQLRRRYVANLNLPPIWSPLTTKNGSSAKMRSTIALILDALGSVQSDCPLRAYGRVPTEETVGNGESVLREAEATDGWIPQLANGHTL